MFLGILGFITGLGGTIRDITAQITNLKIAQVRAGSDEEKAKLGAQIEEAHDRRAVMVAEAGSRVAAAINATMRAYIAIGPASYIAKYYFWDKVVGSFVGCVGKGAPINGCETFNTDGLTTEMAAVMTAVVAFYFVYDMAARSRK